MGWRAPWSPITATVDTVTNGTFQNFGGSPLQVSGPSAALTVVLADTIATHGRPVTCAITVAAGLLQILFGLTRTARAALAISPAIVHGLLALARRRSCTVPGFSPLACCRPGFSG